MSLSFDLASNILYKFSALKEWNSILESGREIRSLRLSFVRDGNEPQANKR